MLITDHRPLQAIFGHKKRLPSLVTARLHRYSMFRSSFTYYIEYCPGSKNVNANALSRGPVANYMLDETSAYILKCFHCFPPSCSVMQPETTKDCLLPQIFRYVEVGCPDKCPNHLVIQPMLETSTIIMRGWCCYSSIDAKTSACRTAFYAPRDNEHEKLGQVDQKLTWTSNTQVQVVLSAKPMQLVHQ